MTVSLSSVLSSYGYNSASTAKTDASAAVSAAMAKLAQSDTTATTIQNTSGTQVTISAAALAAATAKEDNDKDASVLAKEVRAALDAQYAKGTAKGSADMSEFSGRALAIVALNKEGQFSASESRAAKEALREDTRQSFVSAMGSGDAYSMIANYSKQLASQYDSMSAEEREARGWSEDFRNTNADFATNFTMPSLFDQI